MADRTVTVKLEADVAGFVADIGGKAVAAVEALNAAAKGANTSIGKIGADAKINKVTANATTAGRDLDGLGTKATSAAAKISKIGDGAQAAGSKVSTSASTAGKELDRLASSADKAGKATAGLSKTTAEGSKVSDAHANAIGRLRVAQLRLAEVQKQAKPNPASLAGAEESVASAKRALAKLGEDSGKSFGASMKKWFVSDGTNIFADMGKNSGNGFMGALAGALKTPVLGPILLAALLAAVSIALPAVGAVAAGGLVAGFGAGIAGLGILFAAKSDAVGKVWSGMLSRMGEDMKLLSTPFETTLIHIAGFFQRTMDAFNPVLRAAFADMAGPVSTFVDQLLRGFEKFVPAIAPLTTAFNAILGALGPAMITLLGDLATSMTGLANSVAKNPQALADMVTGLSGIITATLSFVQTLNDINTGFSTLTGGVSLVTVLFKGLEGIVGAVAAPFTLLSKVLGGVNALLGKTGGDSANAGKSMLDAAGNTAQLGGAMNNLIDAALHAGPPVLTAAEAAAVAKKKIADATAATNAWIASLFALQRLELGLSGAQISFQAAIDGASASIKTNGRTLDINTEKGRANKSALDSVASSANAQTQAMLDSKKGVRAASDAASASRASFISLAQKMGLSTDAAKALADKVLTIPKKTQTDFKADITDLNAKLASARKQLADPHLSATKKAELRAEIAQLLRAKAQAQAAIDSLSGKTVAVTLNTYKNLIETHTTKSVGVLAPPPKVNADGGYYPHGIPSYADGKLPSQATVAPGKGSGLVQWAEGSTGGEAFIPLAPSKRDRSEMILGQVANTFGMHLVRSFADGGFLPGGNLVDIAFLLRQLGIGFNPSAGVNYGSTLKAQNVANAQVGPARAASLAAARAEAAAKADRDRIAREITLQQRYITQLRVPRSTAKDPKVAAAQNSAHDAKLKQEQRDLIVLQDQLYRAKLRLTGATNASNKADATLKLRVDAATKATQDHAVAVQRLIEQQKLAVDMAAQIASGLTASANIGDLFQNSLTGKGLLADLQGKGSQLGAFRAQIDRLRKQGLSEDLIQQLVGKGSDQGGQAAQAILDGGFALVVALNKAQKALDAQANLIGAGSANKKFGQAISGARASGGQTLANKSYLVGENGPEVLRMGAQGGWVDPNRYIASGGVATVIHEHHYHQTNQFSGVDYTTADVIAQRSVAKQKLMERY